MRVKSRRKNLVAPVKAVGTDYCGDEEDFVQIDMKNLNFNIFDFYGLYCFMIYYRYCES